MRQPERNNGFLLRKFANTKVSHTRYSHTCTRQLRWFAVRSLLTQHLYGATKDSIVLECTVQCSEVTGVLAGMAVVIEKPYATRMDVSAFGAYADALAKHRISAHCISRLDDWSAYCVCELARLSISRIWKSVKSALIFLCAFFLTYLFLFPSLSWHM